MLLIDAGNTRSKFAWWDRASDHIELLGAIPHQRWVDDLSQPLDSLLSDVLSEHQLNDGGRAIGCSVAAVSVTDALNHSLNALGMTVTWQKTQSRQLGVTNGYEDHPETLGADRWMALLGCHEHVTTNALVVDIGTALTLDWLTEHGQHLGGWIVPGQQLMLNALDHGAANLKGLMAQPMASYDPDIGRSTLQGMVQGVEAALTGAVMQAVQVAHEHFGDDAFQVVVTGGGSERLMRAISTPFYRCDDLLFKGLRLCADNLSSA